MMQHSIRHAPTVFEKGTKRRADDSLDDESRFTKRFHLLNIDPPLLSPDHLPPSAPPSTPTTTPKRTSTLPTDFRASLSTSPSSPSKPSRPRAPLLTRPTLPPDQVEHMSIDPTPHRIYISDLDAELSSSSSSDDESSSSSSARPKRLIFLPDIEARFNRIPPEVLRAGRNSTLFSSLSPDMHGQEDGSGEGRMDGPGRATQRQGHGQELVLYGVPKSLSVPEGGEDSVRQALVGVRERARERAMREEEERQRMQRLEEEEREEDPDAMDLG